MAGLAASDKISDLTSERTNWCICVNVVKTWESFESDGLVNVNFLLTNAEVIFNFTVLIDQSERRLTKIKARIVLIDGTGISPGVDPEEYQPMDLVSWRMNGEYMSDSDGSSRGDELFQRGNVKEPNQLWTSCLCDV
ncbi:unnamed protein product [Microthlaspi erraticum]|uniref:DUF223 domain-containing protein n=1 Tax=Microthlaspi erraticum TaxID=1685480 RepID=A0A6D2LB86_9BRAS|nr:unnamed protein product [Microthlaspi erraticum]